MTAPFALLCSSLLLGYTRTFDDLFTDVGDLNAYCNLSFGLTIYHHSLTITGLQCLAAGQA